MAWVVKLLDRTYVGTQASPVSMYARRTYSSRDHGWFTSSRERAHEFKTRPAAEQWRNRHAANSLVVKGTRR